MVGRICYGSTYNSQSYAYHFIVHVEYMHVACCCAAAAGVDLSSSAYPLAVLSLLRPRPILPHLYLSPIAGIRGAAAGYDVPGARIYGECCCCGCCCCSVCCYTAAVVAAACCCVLLLFVIVCLSYDAIPHPVQTAVVVRTVKFFLL